MRALQSRGHLTARPDCQRLRNRLGPVGLAGLLLVSAGCRREEIRVYEAPKERPAAASAGMVSGLEGLDLGDPHAGLNRPRLSWQVPAGWEERPASALRAGYFVIPGPNGQQAEMTIIPLAGTGGNDLDNVNRWRAQVGLKAITAEELPRLAKAVSIGGREGQLYDLVGDSYEADDQRTLAAILRRDGTSWFFKLTGPAALVGDQQGAFVEFLRTLKFEDVGSRTPATAATAPAAGAESAAGMPRFKVPAHWRTQAPGAMQAARFVPEDAADRADISVAMLPGDGGGPLANVNRWRRQLGLGPIGEAELPGALQTRSLGGLPGYWVEIAALESGRRMVAAAVQQGNRTWFYKLTGEASVVEREKPVFEQFVESAAYDAP